MADPVDVAAVSRLLEQAGITDSQSVSCIASTVDGLRSVATELCGDAYMEAQWSALLHLWTTAQGRGSAWMFAQASRHAVTMSYAGVPSDVLPQRPVAVVPACLPLSSLPERAAAAKGRARVTQAVLAACKRTAASSGDLVVPSNKKAKALAAPAGSDGSVVDLSMTMDLALAWEKVLAKCRALLVLLGSTSPSYCELYGRGPPSSVHLAVQDDVFRDKSAAPDTISGHVRAFEDLRRWCACLGLVLTDLRMLDVAAFLKDQIPRGKSVPLRVYRGLCWAERAFGLVLHTGTPQVRSQSSIVVDAGCEHLAESVSAEMATLKMVADMEDLVGAAPSLPLRAYAGACCCLAHGVLRWQDLQRSSSLHLTADALVAVPVMKRKRQPAPWAALRQGFLNIDWAGSWVDVLAEAGLPGKDFVLAAASFDMQTFTRRIARYSDGVGLMRALLVLSGMEAEASLKFTLHSWRHLMPTMARQLRLPEHEQVEIGHWATGSSMPRRYDSTACVTELGAKFTISSAVSNGWTPVGAGCVAAAPPVPLPASPPAAVLPRPKGNFAKAKPCKMKPSKPSRVISSDLKVLDASVQVVHFGTGKVHLWKMGMSTICSAWKCGSPDDAADAASFCKAGTVISDTAGTPYCRLCYSERLSFLRCSAPDCVNDVDGDGDVAPDGSETSCLSSSCAADSD